MRDDSFNIRESGEVRGVKGKRKGKYIQGPITGKDIPD